MKRWILFALPVIAVLPIVSDTPGQFGRGGGRGGAAVGGSRAAAVSGPFGGGGAGVRTGGAVVGPVGGAARAGSGSGSFTTGGGTTIKYGGAGAGVAGLAGGAAGRGVGGVQVTTPGGQSYTKVGTAGGAVGPGGRGYVGGSSIGTTTGPKGSGIGVSGGGAAFGPGGAVGGRYQGGVAIGPQGGVAAGGSRGGVAVGPYGAVAGGSRGVVGVAGPGYRAGAYGARGTYYVSGGALTTRAGYVRTGFGYYHCFNPGWYARYPGAWFAAGWAANTAWRISTWPYLVTYCGYPATPIYYDYGSTVVYQDNSVYINGQSVASASDYAQQAVQIADVGRAPNVANAGDWQPLGVFALVQGEEKNSYKIFELAINKSGGIRGNYYDALADNTLPIFGSVDPKTQRAAWSIGEKKDVVFEAGIANLTRQETTVLVHFGREDTQQMILVRMEQPPDQK